MRIRMRKMLAFTAWFLIANATWSQSASHEENLRLGTQAWMRGDCGTAREHLRTALADQPNDMQVVGILGICEKRIGDPGAEKHLETAFARTADAKLQLETGVELGDLYYQRGDVASAAPVVRRLVELAPENADILFFAQHVYQQMADETMNKLALIAPGSARMQQIVAERLVNEGDLAHAAEHYRAAIVLDANLPGAHYELAEAILEAEPENAQAQEEGRRELELALRVDGEGPRLECEIARLAFLQGKMTAALAHYERAYALNPHEIEAQMGAGRVLMALDKPEQALRYLSEAAAQDPMNAEAHYRRARALRALHRDEEAQSEMKLFETVRTAQAKVRELYRQMHRRTAPETNDLPPAGGAL
jgi:tetratricopeptide (TPR) repeat protein